MSTEIIGQPGAMHGDEFQPTRSTSDGERVKARVMTAISVMLLVVAALVLWNGFRQPHFKVHAGGSLASELDAYYFPGRDPRTLFGAEKKKVALATVSIAQACGMPLALTDLHRRRLLQLTDYQVARSYAGSTDWYRLDSRVYRGDAVDMRWGRIRCMEAAHTKPFSLR